MLNSPPCTWSSATTVRDRTGPAVPQRTGDASSDQPAGSRPRSSAFLYLGIRCLENSRLVRRATDRNQRCVLLTSGCAGQVMGHRAPAAPHPNHSGYWILDRGAADRPGQRSPQRMFHRVPTTSGGRDTWQPRAQHGRLVSVMKPRVCRPACATGMHIA
jgi:hypothetical protein